jgi:dihydrofolate synthase / folylpolyglutamate synthase
VGLFLSMNYPEALAYLYSLGNEVLTAKLGLLNMQVLLEHLGDPQKKFTSILIAGTNGKGSVAAFCDSILRSSGYETGLYTSPHLVQIEERIRVNGRMIPSDTFARLTEEMKNLVTRLMHQASTSGGSKLERHPTYFEMVTAIAFSYFAEQRIELAVLEVGLGGRLDATNVVEPAVAVITNVDLDHQQYLGSSVREIAVEKAGIIKARSRKADGSMWQSPLPVVFSGGTGTALEVVEERCNAVGARLVRVPKDSAYSAKPDELGRFKLQLDLCLGMGVEICLPLAGKHQISNALTAIRVMELLAELGYQVNRQHIEFGISGTKWPGRLEILESQPRIVLDGAHNPAAAEKVKEFIEAFLEPKRVVMVFGVMKDKAIQEISRTLFPLAREIVLTYTGHERCATPSEILSLLPRSESSIRSTTSVCEAITIAEQLASEDDTIVFVGSLFLVGEARKLLLQRAAKTSSRLQSEGLKEAVIA